MHRSQFINVRFVTLSLLCFVVTELSSQQLTAYHPNRKFNITCQRKLETKKVIGAYNQKILGYKKENIRLDIVMTQNGIGLVYRF